MGSLNHNKLRGIIAAPFQAFHSDGSLHLETIGRQAEGLLANRVDQAFVCGTTGEGFSLSFAERQRVAEHWKALAGTRMRLIIQVGCNSLVETRDLAAHARELDPFGVACCPPSFFKPQTVIDLVDYCAQVAQQAPETRFYYYHIPVFTGVNLPMNEFIGLAAERIPNFCGVKFSSNNLLELQLCLQSAGDRHEVWFGKDENLLAALVLGVEAAVGSSYNLNAPLYHRILEAYGEGHLGRARQDQWRAARLVHICNRYGGLNAAKETMRFLGIDCGPVRPPLGELSVESSRALRHELERAGFFEDGSIVPGG